MEGSSSGDFMEIAMSVFGYVVTIATNAGGAGLS